MKFRKFFMYILLFTLSLQVMHAFTFAELEVDSCTVEEYANEFVQSVDHGDICDIHFEYHTSYLLPATVNIVSYEDVKTSIQIRKEIPQSNILSSIFKPPINL